MNFSDLLRNQIKRSTLEYIADQNIQPDGYEEHKSAIIFKTPDGDTSNPNFLAKSLKAIIKHKNWKERLGKIHSHFDDGTTEMASSNSSDALLMNIFCHPDFFSWSGPKKYLGFDDATPQFGYIPKIEESSPYTEVDMKLGSTLFEAKLTEKDFTHKEYQRVLERYPEIEEVFYLEGLKSGDNLKHYQLLRNIFAAYKKDMSFKLLCDARRPDLIQALLETTKAVKDYKLRKRIGFITWQEIAAYLGKDLKDFLSLKYDING